MQSDDTADEFTPIKTCLDDVGLKINAQIYRAIETLGGDPGLLSCVGSWGDTLDDADILEMVTAWNEMGEPFIPIDRARSSHEGKT